MKKWLVEELICPQCLDNEFVLNPDIQIQTDDEIIEGKLICPNANRCMRSTRGLLW